MGLPSLVYLFKVPRAPKHRCTARSGCATEEKTHCSGGFADEGSAGRRWMIFVPGGDAGGVAGDQYVVVDDVEGEAAVDVEPRAFVFVKGEEGREMGDDV